MEREREKEDGKAWEGFELIRVFSKSRGKEFLAGIVILILMASLCGCGNPDEEGYSGETNIAQIKDALAKGNEDEIKALAEQGLELVKERNNLCKSSK